MIKVTVGEQKPQAENQYPRLMNHIDGTITIFHRIGVGIHIFAPMDVIGRGCIMWHTHNGIDMDGYTDFNGEVTLKNS